MEEVNTCCKYSGTGTYYKHSGIITRLGVFCIILFGTIGAAFLGCIYGFAAHAIPFAFIRIFLPILYGILLGQIIGGIGKICKIRNLQVLLFAGIIFGIFAVYTGWVSWFFAVSEKKLLILSPPNLLLIIKISAITGVWSFKGTTPTGWGLYSIWIAEALIIIGYSAYYSYKIVKDSQFCEKCNRWIEKHPPISFLTPIYDVAEFKSQISHGNSDILTELKFDPGMPWYTRLELSYCISCRELFLLTVKDITIQTDSKGKQSEIEKTIIENLLIEHRLYTLLTEHSDGAVLPNPHKTTSIYNRYVQ